MKRMKKLVSLLLAVVMLLGVTSIFTQAKSEKYDKTFLEANIAALKEYVETYGSRSSSKQYPEFLYGYGNYTATLSSRPDGLHFFTITSNSLLTMTFDYDIHYVVVDLQCHFPQTTSFTKAFSFKSHASVKTQTYDHEKENVYFTNEALLNEQSDQTYNELANRIFSNSFVLFEALLAEHGWYISEIGFAQYCPGHTKTLSYDPKEATCTKTGTKTTLCAYCGLVMKEETIPTTAHQWNSGTVTKKATCSEAGVLTYTCQKCGTTKTETIPATAHQWNSGAVTKQASCNENGEMTYTCELCGTTRTESIPMTAHQWDAGVVTKSATCVETGEMTYTCLECSATKTEAIAKTTHNYVSSVVPATMATDGQVVSSCSVCGKVKKTKAINQINSVKLSQTSFVYDGTAKKPTVTVKDSKGKVINSKYYTVKYAKGCTEIGAYKVKIIFKDMYSGTASCVFKIIPGKVTDLKAASKKTGIAKAAWSPVDGAQKYVVYCSTTKKGSYQKVAVTAKTAYNVKGLASGKTYYFVVKALTQTGGKNYFSAVSNIAKAKVK